MSMALSFLLLSKAMMGSVLAAYRYTFDSSWKSTLKRLVTRGTEGHLLRWGPRLRVARAFNISMIMNFGQISWHLWSKIYGLYYNLHTWLIERKNILTQNQQQLTHSKTLKLVPRLKVYPEGLYLHGSDLTALMNMMVSGYQKKSMMQVGNKLTIVIRFASSKIWRFSALFSDHIRTGASWWRMVL